VIRLKKKVLSLSSTAVDFIAYADLLSSFVWKEKAREYYPPIVRMELDADFLSEIAFKIEQDRPDFRRDISCIDLDMPEGYLMVDAAFPPFSNHSLQATNCLSIEIKVSSLALIFNSVFIYYPSQSGPSKSIVQKSIMITVFIVFINYTNTLKRIFLW
jgi:hypothetical protein